MEIKIVIELKDLYGKIIANHTMRGEKCLLIFSLGCHISRDKYKKLMEERLKWLQNKGVHTIKSKPSAAGKRLYEKFVFCDSGKMELRI